MPGAWPTPSDGELAGLAAALASVPDGGIVLVDGLVGSAAAGGAGAGGGAAAAGAARPPAAGHSRRGGVLARGPRGVTTSPWTRLAGAGVHVATPGVDPAPVATPSPAGDRLLCVAAVAAHKGQDRLADALAAVPEPFTCTYVGSLTREPDFVAALRTRLDDRIRLAGTLAGPELAAAYAGTDLLVSRVPRRDVRDGRDRGACPWDPGAGGPGRRTAGRARPRPRRQRARPAGRGGRAAPVRSAGGSPTPPCGSGCGARPWTGGRR